MIYAALLIALIDNALADVFSLASQGRYAQSFRMVNWQEIRSVRQSCGVADGLYAARKETRDTINTAFLALIESNSGYDAMVIGHSLGAAHAAVAATELPTVNSTSTSLVRRPLLFPYPLSNIDIRLVYLRPTPHCQQRNDQSNRYFPQPRWP